MTPAATTTATQQAVEGSGELGTTAPAAAAAPAKPPLKTYKVVAGDTLSGIAKRAGLKDFAELYALNKDLIGPDPSKLAVGQELKLPEGATEPGAPAPQTSRHRGNGRGNNGNGLGNGGSNRGTGGGGGDGSTSGGGGAAAAPAPAPAPAAPTSTIRQIDGKGTDRTDDDTYGTFVNGHRIGLKMM